MAIIEFCFNSTFTPIWNHGISACFYKTVQPIVVFVLAIIVLIYHEYNKWKCSKSRRKKPTDSQQQGLIQNAEDIEAIPVVNIGQSEDVPNRKCFKDFPFPELPMPFLYVVQLLLHVLLFLMPVVHIILKLIICKECLDGAHILTAVLNFLAWIITLRSLKHERKYFFFIKEKRHSIAILVFWTIALLFEAVVFFSWDNPKSFLHKYEDNAKLLDLVMFSLKFALHSLTFVIGLRGPGLYKAKYDQVYEIYSLFVIIYKFSYNI